jgi:hypothetical protein
MTHVTIKNKSGSNINAFVTTWSGGGFDAWYPLHPGEEDTWKRNSNGWDLVAFKDDGDTHRAGVYVKLPKTIVFNAFNDIRIVDL